MDTTAADSHSSSPPVAFAITLAAGAATWVGALVVFIPIIVKKTSARVFAAALGLSAGFLAYISTIKIFVESYENFVSSGLSEGRAYTYTTICFFGGAVSLKVSRNMYIRCLSDSCLQPESKLRSPTIIIFICRSLMLLYQ